jgi:hypothetical protein
VPGVPAVDPGRSAGRGRGQPPGPLRTPVLFVFTMLISLYWAGLVCLGFPLCTLGGVRGGGGDSLLDLRTPVLFVVGERAAGSTPHDLEDLRQHQNLLGV